jgi:transcriptional regulator with XRE-family HTH domain
MQRFGEKLRALRKQRGMTMIELADALGYAAHSHLSEIENGKRAPSLKLAVKVAQVFNTTTDLLLNDALDLPLDATADRDPDG